MKEPDDDEEEEATESVPMLVTTEVPALVGPTSSDDAAVRLEVEEVTSTPPEKELSGVTLGDVKSRAKIDRQFFRRIYHLLKNHSGTECFSKIHFYITILFLIDVGYGWVTVLAALWYGDVISALTKGEEVWNRLPLGFAYYLTIAICRTLNGFLGDLLAWHWRKNITESVTSKYLSGNNPFYINVFKQVMIDNPDQRIGADIKSFCDSLGTVVAGVFQSLCVITILSVNMYQLIGWYALVMVHGPVILFFIAYVILLKKIAHYTFIQDKKEGDFRYAHARIRDNAESIAFYAYDCVKGGRGGGEDENEDDNGGIEKQNCNDSLEAAVQNKRIIAKWFSLFKFLNALNRWTTEIIIFFGSGLILWGLNLDSAQISSILTSLQSEAFLITMNIEQLVTLGTPIGIVAGSLGRISQLIEMCDSLTSSEKKQTKNLIDADKIALTNVTCVTPLGTTLVENLSLTVERSQNLLIMGPSGCGKSSLLRCFAGLWDFKGTIHRPKNDFSSRAEIMYFTQKPFLVYGTLKHQIIYPQEPKTSLPSNSERNLIELLKRVNLLHIYKQRGLNNCHKWTEILSPGEQQRLMFARVLYHRPKYVVLDEPTSALDESNEQHLLKECISNNETTIICVSHHQSEALLRFFSTVLVLDGIGGYKSYNLKSEHDRKAFDETEQKWTKVIEKPGSLEPEESVIDFNPPGITSVSSSSSLKGYLSRLWNILRLAHGKCCCTCSSTCKFLGLFFFCSIASSSIAGILPIAFRRLADSVVSHNESSFYQFLLIATLGVILFSLTFSGSQMSSYFLGILYRSKLSKVIHNLYFQDHIALKINTIHNKEIDNPDSRIQISIDNFTNGFEPIGLMTIMTYGVLAIPIPLFALVVLVYFTGWLSLPLEGGIIILMNVAVLPFLPILSVKEFNLTLKDSDFRYQHIQTKENAEAIGFYGKLGLVREKKLLDHLFQQVMNAQWELIKIKNLSMIVFFIFISSTTGFGLVVVLLALNYSGTLSKTPLDRRYGLISQSISVAGIAMITSALIVMAMGRLALNNAHLRRITELLDKIQSLLQDKDDTSKLINKTGNSLEINNLLCETPTGKRLNSEGISLTVKPKENLLIMGPSGCGKSTLLRTIGGLWPHPEGHIKVPTSVFFLPQKPYMVLGNLQHQIIYPQHSKGEKTIEEADLVRAMKKAKIDYLLKRFTFDDIQRWDSVLSPGEQQRLSLARLFYHHPQFVIMDESTSALDPKNEKIIFETLQEENITMIAVSHSSHLMKYFHLMLKFDGNGGWSLLKKS